MNNNIINSIFLMIKIQTFSNYNVKENSLTNLLHFLVLYYSQYLTSKTACFE